MTILDGLVSAIVGAPTYSRVMPMKTVSATGLVSLSLREEATHASSEVYTIVQPTSAPGENVFSPVALAVVEPIRILWFLMLLIKSKTYPFLSDSRTHPIQPQCFRVIIL